MELASVPETPAELKPQIASDVPPAASRAIAMLNEFCQRSRCRAPPQYSFEVVRQDLFMCNVMLPDPVKRTSPAPHYGRSKKAAKGAAAIQMYTDLINEGIILQNTPFTFNEPKMEPKPMLLTEPGEIPEQYVPLPLRLPFQPLQEPPSDGMEPPGVGWKRNLSAFLKIEDLNEKSTEEIIAEKTVVPPAAKTTVADNVAQPEPTKGPEEPREPSKPSIIEATALDMQSLLKEIESSRNDRCFYVQIINASSKHGVKLGDASQLLLVQLDGVSAKNSYLFDVKTCGENVFAEVFDAVNSSGRVCGYLLSHQLLPIKEKYGVCLRQWCELSYVASFLRTEYVHLSKFCNDNGKNELFLEARLLDQYVTDRVKLVQNHREMLVEILLLYPEYYIQERLLSDLVRLSLDQVWAYDRIAFEEGEESRRELYLLTQWRDHPDVVDFSHVTIVNQVESILSILPEWYHEDLRAVKGLTDLFLSIGRPLSYFANRTRKSLETAPAVSWRTMEHILENVTLSTHHTRGGIEGTLHRVAVIRDRTHSPYALTIRNGRVVEGIATIIKDIISSNKSILLLGTPGSGKTSFLRDMVRIRAKSPLENICVVDTNNEIAGEGLTTHPFIGEVIRLMVHNPDHQVDVMLEALLNHSPTTICIDEIRQAKEVRGCHTVKYRGVRLFASVHGSLEGLFQNDELQGLVGNFHAELMKHDMARKAEERAKRTRITAPIFDCAIQLKPSRNEAGFSVQIIHSIKRAIDCLTEKKPFELEIRSISSNGCMWSATVDSNDLRKSDGKILVAK